MAQAAELGVPAVLTDNDSENARASHQRGRLARRAPGFIACKRVVESKYAKTKDYYEVLGVPRTATRKRSRPPSASGAQAHPDRNAAKQAEARFKEDLAGHDVLTDAKKRSLYDEFGSDGRRLSSGVSGPRVVGVCASSSLAQAAPQYGP